MSTILDSLKKSSDKRDDNNKNSIDNFSFSGGSSNRKSKFPVVFILLLITAAILYFGYLYLYNDEKTDKISDAQPALVNSSKIKPVSSDINLSSDSLVENQKQDKPNSKDVKQRIKEIKERREQQALENGSSPVVAETSNKNTGSIVKDETNNGSSEIKKNEEDLKAPEISLTMPDEKQAATQPVEKIEQKYPYVYQLPFNLRKDIPKLKLNIHVYDKDPDNRIAIINGVRFAIEDMIDDIVLVKDIIPEGVILEFNNKVFLIPK